MSNFYDDRSLDSKTINEDKSIFLSYSKRELDPAVCDLLQVTLREALRAKNWKINDPMEYQDALSISEKVFRHLFNSRAMIAEATHGIPNVMIEIGAAKALGMPTLILLREGSPESDILAKMPRRLPADLGDVEYFLFPNDPLLGDWNKFRHQIEIWLELLDARLPGSVMSLRGAEMHLREKLNELVEYGYHRTKRIFMPDFSPTIHIVSGWLGEVGREVGQIVHGDFFVDKDYYRSCLQSLSELRGVNVRAVADRTSAVEKGIWEDVVDSRTRVTERLFLVDWRTFYERDRLEILAETLRREAEKGYVVLIDHAPNSRRRNAPHFPDSSDLNVLLIEPDLVARYGKRAERDVLRFRRDAGVFSDENEEYNRLREGSVFFKKGMTAQELFAEWARRHSIGKWKRSWSKSKVEDRDSSYFELYDLHIRCWIPNYDDLLAECRVATEMAILARLRSSSEPIKIMEIGFGTGALTVPLLHWVDSISEPFDESGVATPVRYVGIDRADRWGSSVRSRLNLSGNSANVKLIRASALTAMNNVRQRLFDVICGSLVLHDILGANPVDELASFLKDATPFLAVGGKMIFADLFFDAEIGQKERQRSSWMQWMRDHAMTEAEVSEFMRGNDEMEGAIDVGALSRVAITAGYSDPVVIEIPTGRDWNPFKVIVIERLR